MKSVQIEFRRKSFDLYESVSYKRYPFEIGGAETKHAFYVVRSMNRKLILGRDWLQQNGVRLYFDLGCIRLHQAYIPLQEDIHVTSIVHLRSKTKIKPQTAVLCNCKVKNNPNLPFDRTYQISPKECGFLSHEPCLMVTNSVGKLKSNRVLPIMIVNNTKNIYS